MSNIIASAYYIWEAITMTRYGIDVSRWQGNIDWTKVKVDFCIMQAGFGRELSQKDICFDNNYNGCKKNKIPCGAYWYSYAQSEDEARLEAKVCIETIKNKQFEYPIYYDVEEQRTLDLGREKVSAIIKAFLDELEKAGYFAGLYMSAYFLKEYVNDSIKNRYAVWVAHHGVNKPDYTGKYGMWQKSNTGSVAGINGNVDLDECYVDYPADIKSAGLNGFPKAPNKQSKFFKITVDNKTYSGTLTEI